jgi:transposase
MSQNNTYFLGFDVSKLKLDVSLVDGQGIEQWASIVQNDSVSLLEFLSTVAACQDDANEIVCVVESTACYHYPLLDATTALGIQCRLLNPLVTKQQIKASVRGKKTDRTDATMIARLGLRGEGRLCTPEHHRNLKHQIRSYQKLGHFKTTLRRHTNHVAEQLGPEFNTMAQEFEAIQDSLMAARAALYCNLAKSAQGEVFLKLQTIPGIGPYIASSLIAEIQTMGRFPSAHTLVAYAGLDPKIRQSGHTLNNTGRLTKRGSSHLRRSIFIAASVARQHDPNLKVLYNKKCGEGKPYTVATIVVARKLLAIVRAVWLSGKDYDANFCRRG